MIDTTLDRLRRHGSIEIDRFELGTDAAPELETLGLLGKDAPPERLLDFYTATNGITLLWHGTIAGAPVAGSLNILSLMLSGLRAPGDGMEEPLEGVLWTNDTPEPERAELQAMTVFESVAGRDDFITYKHGDPALAAYLVSDWEITPFPMPLDELATQLVHYGGADKAREYLLQPDWQDRLAADSELQALFGAG